MNKLKQIIKTIITNEIEPDVAVFNDGYTIAPFTTYTALKGDGKPQEIATGYQLDFFFKSKGETVAKAKALIEALGDYPVSDLTYTWETTVRLWRATMTIETI